MTIFNSVNQIYSFLEHSQIRLTKVSEPMKPIALKGINSAPLSVSFDCGYTRAALSLAQLGKTRHFPMIIFRN